MYSYPCAIGETAEDVFNFNVWAAVPPIEAGGKCSRRQPTLRDSDFTRTRDVGLKTLNGFYICVAGNKIQFTGLSLLRQFLKTLDRGGLAAAVRVEIVIRP